MQISERSAIINPPYPAELVAATHHFLNATLDLFGKDPRSRKFAELVLKRYPEHASQVWEAATPLKLDVVDVMLANLCYDVLVSNIACSTIAFASKDGPLIARNLDWFPPSLMAKASAVVPTTNGLAAGFLGGIGIVTGLSNNGFAVILNAASDGQSNPDGYPMLLFLRSVLDHANDYDQAFEMIKTRPLMSGGLITIVGTRNEQRAVVERTPTTAQVRTPRGDEPLITTNHYRVQAAIPECSRYAWLGTHVNSVKDPMELLTNENVRQTITAQHVLLQPASKTLRLFVPTYLLDPGFKDEAYDLRELLADF